MNRLRRGRKTVDAGRWPEARGDVQAAILDDAYHFDRACRLAGLVLVPEHIERLADRVGRRAEPELLGQISIDDYPRRLRRFACWSFTCRRRSIEGSTREHGHLQRREEIALYAVHTHGTRCGRSVRRACQRRRGTDATSSPRRKACRRCGAYLRELQQLTAQRVLAHTRSPAVVHDYQQ